MLIHVLPWLIKLIQFASSCFANWIVHPLAMFGRKERVYKGKTDALSSQRNGRGKRVLFFFCIWYERNKNIKIFLLVS